MFRVQFTKDKVSLETKSKPAPVAVEQFPAKEFFDNNAGWSRNDLAALVAATTKQEYDMLVQRLQVNDPTFNVKDGTKVADAIKSIKPRWCQSANEIVSYVDALTRANLDDAYNKALEDVNINAEKPMENQEIPSEKSE